MRFSFKGFLYQLLADPSISRLHSSVLGHIDSTHRVLDVACGTGSLSIAMAGRAKQVMGIDLSEDMIITAQRVARRKRIENTLFELRDATDLSYFTDKQFDVAVTSMAVHQFDALLAVKILSEMGRIAHRVIIVDYNSFMPKGFYSSGAWTIERMAGGDHYRNFAVFMKRGGIRYFAAEAGLLLKSEATRGGGVFAVVICS
ncbi:MAG TPA: class I SAM-dependent methyltransferase [Bacteroidales bacterium]|nr:class I SAM-dependent methyltransferase [Bacteroidales bacterium]